MLLAAVALSAGVDALARRRGRAGRAPEGRHAHGVAVNERAVRFPLFDSLRAIAVLLVLAYHVLDTVLPTAGDAAIRPYAAHMSVGVSIFFVISGFLLYRPFVAARVHGRRWIPLRVYAWRRFLRIVPGYWVALTVIALWLGLPGVLSGSGIVRYYLFGQIYERDALFGGLAAGLVAVRGGRLLCRAPAVRLRDATRAGPRPPRPPAVRVDRGHRPAGRGSGLQRDRPLTGRLGHLHAAAPGAADVHRPLRRRDGSRGGECRHRGAARAIAVPPARPLPGPGLGRAR